MDNRNTFADSKKYAPKPNRGGQSQQRQTMMPQMNSQTKSSPAQNVERMTRKIQGMLLKLHEKPKIKQIGTSLKPNTKAFMTVCSVLINQIDTCPDENIFDIDGIIRMASGLGYTGNLGKGESFNSLFLNEYEQETSLGQKLDKLQPKALEIFLNNDIHDREEIINQLNFTSNTIELAAKNLQASQHSLEDMVKEEKSMRDIYFRQEQLAIEADRKNIQLCKQIEQIDEEIHRAVSTVANKQTWVQTLENEINAQDMTAQEAEKIREMLRLEREKLATMKRDYDYNILPAAIQSHHNLLDKLLDLKGVLRDGRQTLNPHYSTELQKRGYIAPDFQFDHAAFLAYLKDFKLKLDKEKISEILQEKAVVMMASYLKSCMQLQQIEMREKERQSRKLQNKIADTNYIIQNETRKFQEVTGDLFKRKSNVQQKSLGYESMDQNYASLMQLNTQSNQRCAYNRQQFNRNKQQALFAGNQCHNVSQNIGKLRSESSSLINKLSSVNNNFKLNIRKRVSQNRDYFRKINQQFECSTDIDSEK